MWLYGANLSWANLEGGNLREDNYNANTTWPEDFDPEAAGAVLVKDDDRPAGSECIVGVWSRCSKMPVS